MLIWKTHKKYDDNNNNTESLLIENNSIRTNYIETKIDNLQKIPSHMLREKKQ